MIWDKVALNESVILHRLTQSNADTEYFENLVRKPGNHSNAKSSDNCINCRLQNFRLC